MEDFRELMARIVQAPSMVQKRKEIGRMSVAFYELCREQGLEKEDIINLTTQILDCFLTDLNYLREKVEKRGRKKAGKASS